MNIEQERRATAIPDANHGAPQNKSQWLSPNTKPIFGSLIPNRFWIIKRRYLFLFRSFLFFFSRLLFSNYDWAFLLLFYHRCRLFDRGFLFNRSWRNHRFGSRFSDSHRFYNRCWFSGRHRLYNRSWFCNGSRDWFSDRSRSRDRCRRRFSRRCFVKDFRFTIGVGNAYHFGHRSVNGRTFQVAPFFVTDHFLGHFQDFYLDFFAVLKTDCVLSKGIIETKAHRYEQKKNIAHKFPSFILFKYKKIPEKRGFSHISLGLTLITIRH